MAFSGYFYTEKVKGARNDAWTFCGTTINGTLGNIILDSSIGSIRYLRSVGLVTDIYLYSTEPTEPAGDGLISLTEFSGTVEDAYSGADGEIVKSFTSEAGFFTSNQNFGQQEDTWVIHYNCKSVDIDAGYNGYIQFFFYKRDTDNNDTLLFSSNKFSSTIFKSQSGYNNTVIITGSVATTDRLRIKVKVGQEILV